MLSFALAAAATPDWAASATIGAGGSVVLDGGTFSGGVAERFGADVPLSRVSALSLELSHTRHRLRDASGLFPDDEVTASAVEGFRDYVAVDLGARLGVPVGSGSVVPWARFGLAGVYTTTLLGMASFDGRVVLRSDQLAPALSLGAGCEARVLPFLAVLPHLLVQGLVAEDVGEADHHGVWRVSWRLQPAIDVSFHL